MSSLFVRAGSPHPCGTDLFLSDGTGARCGAVATVVQALQSLCRGGDRLPASFLHLFLTGKQLCPEVCAYSALLAPRPVQSPQVFQASLLLLGWPSLSGTVQAQPVPGAKKSLSNLEGF